jgi:DedD protein
MIRLPSFFKRKTQADDLELGSGGRRSAKRAAPRSFQRATEAEELALTEDPEQQRARHRLIGAAVLVLIAVVGLPRILDSRPKTAPNDIAVNIVTSLPIPGAETKAEVKSEEKSKTEAVVETPKAAVPAPEVKTEAKPEAKAEVKPSAPAPSKAPGLGLAAGEEVVATASSAKPSVDTANASANNAAANAPTKYFIQVGAYASESNLKDIYAKLKGQKLAYIVLNKTTSDGAKLAVVRVGPYTDKDTALAAEKKVKAVNLPTKLITIGKQ